MNTIHEILAQATKILKANNIATPRLDGEVILSHILGWERIDLILNHDKILDEKYIKDFYEKIEERSKGIPVQYITGHQEFMGLDFKVSPDVLIPRPDTEILVEAAIEEASLIDGPITIVEIGTGSGAIALSLAHYIKDSIVHTIDISPKALSIARANAKKLSLESKARFYQGDLFSPLGDEFLGQVDILVSNPPYIRKEDMANLQREVGFEPSIALDGGEDGLKYYRKILEEGIKYLSPKARIIFEVGHDQARPVEKIIKETKAFKYVIIKKDLSGIGRVVLAKK